MAKFDYKKWVTENKHGKSIIHEQGVADFEVKKEQTNPTGSGTSGTGSASTGSASTGSGTTSGTGSASTGSTTTGSGTTSGTGSASTGSTTGSATTGSSSGTVVGTGSSTSGSITTSTSIQGGPYPSNFNPQSWFEKFQLKIKGFKDQRRLCEYLDGLIETWTVKMNSATTGPATDNALLAKIQMVENLMEEMGCNGLGERMVKEKAKSDFPDLTGDGKTTYADVLKGRGVELKENKTKYNFKKKITKRTLKNIIKEELSRSLINEQWSGEGCASYLATSDPKCVKCASSQPTPYVSPAFGALDTGPQCQCCDDERSTGGEDVRGCLNPAQSGATNVGMPCPGSVGTVTLHHEPCCKYDVTSGEGCDTTGNLDTNPSWGMNCWFCIGDYGPGGVNCIEINTPMLQNNAASSGQTLHSTQQACHSSTSNDCPGEDTQGEMLNCQCCKGSLPQSMIPIPASTPGGCSSHNGVNGQYGCTSGTAVCKKPLPTGEIPTDFDIAVDDLGPSPKLSGPLSGAGQEFCGGGGLITASRTKIYSLYEFPGSPSPVGKTLKVIEVPSGFDANNPDYQAIMNGSVIGPVTSGNTNNSIQYPFVQHLMNFEAWDSVVFAWKCGMTQYDAPKQKFAENEEDYTLEESKKLRESIQKELFGK